MSLYNMLFGVEPTAGIALKMLGIGPGQVPRFRDAFFDWEDDTNTKPVIVIRTRTGGGNRDHYEQPNDDNVAGPWNSSLRALSGYLCDVDDDFDSTYADFYFEVPEQEQAAVVKFLSDNGAPPSSREKWDAALAALKSK
jgi:hypothetical protein